MEKLLNASQLAEIIGIKPVTVYCWITRGVDIPHIKVNKTIRFREKAVQEWLLRKEEERKKRNFEA